MIHVQIRECHFSFFTVTTEIKFRSSTLTKKNNKKQQKVPKLPVAPHSPSARTPARIKTNTTRLIDPKEIHKKKKNIHTFIQILFRFLTKNINEKTKPKNENPKLDESYQRALYDKSAGRYFVRSWRRRLRERLRESIVTAIRGLGVRPGGTWGLLVLVGHARGPVRTVPHRFATGRALASLYLWLCRPGGSPAVSERFSRCSGDVVRLMVAGPLRPLRHRPLCPTPRYHSRARLDPPPLPPSNEPPCPTPSGRLPLALQPLPPPCQPPDLWTPCYPQRPPRSPSAPPSPLWRFTPLGRERNASQAWSCFTLSHSLPADSQSSTANSRFFYILTNNPPAPFIDRRYRRPARLLDPPYTSRLVDGGKKNIG